MYPWLRVTYAVVQTGSTMARSDWAMNFKTRWLSGCATAGIARVAAEAAKKVRLRMFNLPLLLFPPCLLGVHAVPELPATVSRRSEFPQHLAQCRTGIGGAGQAATLQRGHQTFGDFGNETAAGALEWCADQEPVAAHRLHHQAHALGHRIGRTDEFQLRLHRLDPLSRKV